MLKGISGWVPDVMGLSRAKLKTRISGKQNWDGYDSYMDFPIKLEGNVTVPISNLFENYQNRITLGWWSSQNQELFQGFIIEAGVQILQERTIWNLWQHPWFAEIILSPSSVYLVWLGHFLAPCYFCKFWSWRAIKNSWLKSVLRR